MNTHDIADAALAGLEDGYAIVRATHSVNVRWANSALTTNGDTQSTNLTVVAIRRSGDSAGLGVVSGQAADTDEAHLLALQANAVAASATPTDAAAPTEAVVHEDFELPPDTLDPALTDRLVGLVDGFLRQPAPQFGYAQVDTTTTYLTSTEGHRLRSVLTSPRFEASARTPDGTTWWGANTLDADFAGAASRQAHLLGLSARQEDLSPGRHRVILTPGALADLLIYMIWSANGRDAAEGHNVFSEPGGGTRLGQRLTPRSVSLFSDPEYPGLQTPDYVVVEADSSTESVFDNGLPLGRTEVLRNGILTALRASRPTAATFGLEPAYLADNLVFTDDAGTGDLDELIARTKDAVLINCLWYIREVDPQNLLLTGLTRDGVYRVREGQIVASLPNFRFNVSVPDLLARIADASTSGLCLPREWADWFTRTSMPAVVVDGFNLSSPSEAR
ncbi:MAG: metallopeptidase TldD-related protein [Candidatus Nanopelagicales bacterium]|nr:metallopeptidase TldD-related protein [Candidatus Nanopelagicales bacterium]